MTANHNILVIDDVENVGESVNAAANPLGLNWKATRDLSALPRLLTPEIRLILLDPSTANMTDNGTLHTIRKQHADVEIVLMSRDQQLMKTADRMAISYGLAVAGHITKPFPPTELKTVLQSYASHHEGTVPQVDPGINFDENELQRAIERNEFVLHYQPQIDLRTGKVIGIEAFARWKHPQQGLTFPDSFIGGIRSLGLLGDFDTCVMNCGFSELNFITENHPEALRLTLKLSCDSLGNPEFPNLFAELAKMHGVPLGNSMVDVSLNRIIDTMPFARDVLTRLRMKDVLVAVDDYGMGDVRISDLRNIFASELKINETFVQNIATNEGDRSMVEKIIRIAHELGMTVAAQGVENPEELEFLRRKGCDLAQGYLFSHPLPSEKIREWLRSYSQTSRPTEFIV